ncbi:MAG: hypothetical protein JNL32_09080 [Candidatus Kapabacteria bacterium]|nr:hypothetical protein [Candidatus Kapabacteria bacterium]
MKEIRSLATREGRALVREMFRELRFDKQLGGLATLSILWRVCCTEKEVFRYSHHEVVVLHPLGILSGTSLWMQEIVNRFYYSTINSFVYFGAAILLVVIGVRRFTDSVSDTAVLASIGFEAFLLVMMFVVMFFSPTDETDEDEFSDAEQDDTQDVLREIGEIGRDYAKVAVQIDDAVRTLRDIAFENAELARSIRTATETAAHAVAPNPELISRMSETNESLKNFQQSVDSLSTAAKQLQREQIDLAVRREVERLLVQRTGA